MTLLYEPFPPVCILAQLCQSEATLWLCPVCVNYCLCKLTEHLCIYVGMLVEHMLTLKETTKCTLNNCYITIRVWVCRLAVKTDALLTKTTSYFISTVISHLIELLCF